MPIHLVIADDHPIVLDGLRSLFGEPDFRILAACRDGKTALEAVFLHQPHVAILDMQMPALTGLAVVQAIQDRKANTRTVILAASFDDADVVKAIGMGVHGIVLKEAAPRQLLQCVRAVAAGGKWLDREVVGRALENLDQQRIEEQRSIRLLTPREMEIVQLVARGLRNKEIAREASLTEGTIKMYLHNIYDKLGVTSRTELAIFAKNNKLG